MFSLPGRASDAGPDTRITLAQLRDGTADEWHDPRPDPDLDREDERE